MCGTALAFVGSAQAVAQPANIQAKPPRTVDGQLYSLPAAAKIPPRVLWGDTHLHTDNSFDAGLMGTRLGPEDAFRFARGETVVSTAGVPAN